MGRTNPTYWDALRAIEERWTDSRRALRRRDQLRLDRLFEYAREHADAGGLLNHQNPLLPALLSIDTEQEARLDDHEERPAELEQTLEQCGRAVLLEIPFYNAVPRPGYIGAEKAKYV